MDNHDVIYMEPRCHGCSYEAKGGAGLIWCEEDVWTKCEECGEKPAKYLRATPEREAVGELLEALERAERAIDGALRSAGQSTAGFLAGRRQMATAQEKVAAAIAKAKP